MFLLGSSLLLCKIGISLQLPWCFQACAEIPVEGLAEASQTHFSHDLSRCLVGKVQSWGCGFGRTALELCGDRGDTTVRHLGSSSALTRDKAVLQRDSAFLWHVLGCHNHLCGWKVALTSLIFPVVQKYQRIFICSHPSPEPG